MLRNRDEITSTIYLALNLNLALALNLNLNLNLALNLNLTLKGGVPKPELGNETGELPARVKKVSQAILTPSRFSAFSLVLLAAQHGNYRQNPDGQ